MSLKVHNEQKKLLFEIMSSENAISRGIMLEALVTHI